MKVLKMFLGAVLIAFVIAVGSMNAGQELADPEFGQVDGNPSTIG
ncbi:hypothetical protein [Ornithinibacillus gellani]|nr:hypothetical protein [Ornithinibacillus gellani]